MKQGKLLLLDSNPTSGLCQMLQGVFESSDGLNARFHPESLKRDISNLLTKDLSKIVSNFNPDTVFLISSHSLFNHTCTLLRSLRTEFTNIPLLLVMDECPPEGVFDLLKLGATDFITPPLRPADVLPRIWRLLEQNTPTEILHQTLMEKIGLQHIIGKDPVFLAEIQKIPLVVKK